MSSLVLVEEVAPHVRRLTMSRPEQLNAMTAELCQALHEEVARTAAERSCRALILTGAGRGFCASVAAYPGTQQYGLCPVSDSRRSAGKSMGPRALRTRRRLS